MSVNGFVRQWDARRRHLTEEVGHAVRHRLSRLTSTPVPVSPTPTVVTEPQRRSDIQIISSLEELDKKFQEIDAAWAISDDAMREVFATIEMSPALELPSDPTSSEYADRQFELYRLIAGQGYQINNERSDFPVDPNRPFPYYTESFETVGHQLMALGFIIRTMGLPSGASILDLGPGWGNTTVALARMGYDVTAIDVDPSFVDLIRARAAMLSLSIATRVGTFLEIDELQRHFDAVLFFESFHHCSDHRALLQKLAGVLTPGGRLFFAAEPITDAFSVPWGLRLDGESLWAIRRNGWLELGFQESYFLRTLQHLGWIANKHVTSATHLGVIFEARRANGRYEMSTFHLPPDEDITWALPETDEAVKHRCSARSSVLSVERGLDAGTLVIEGVNLGPRAVPFRVEHGRNVVAGIAQDRADAVIRLPYDPAADHLVIQADTWRPSDLLHTGDSREIGLAVKTVSWVADPG